MAEIEMDVQPVMMDPMAMAPMGVQPMVMADPMAMAPMGTPQMMPAPTDVTTTTLTVPVPLQVHGTGQLVHHVPKSDSDNLQYGRFPQVVECAKCGNIVYTLTDYSLTSTICYRIEVFFLSLFTFGLACCLLLSYYAPERRVKVKHECPVCFAEVGRMNRELCDKVE